MKELHIIKELVKYSKRFGYPRLSKKKNIIIILHLIHEIGQSTIQFKIIITIIVIPKAFGLKMYDRNVIHPK